MAEFVLVHGGMHRRECWSELERELRTLGHDTLATEHPCDDLDAGTADYARIVAEQMSGSSDDVIVVGHSIGGLIIPLLPDLRPVGKLVFLCAKIPAVGLSFADQSDSTLPLATGPDLLKVDDHGRIIYTDAGAVLAFYHDVERPLVERSLAQLRPQCLKPMSEVTPLTRWPAVPMWSIYCTEDQTTPGAYSRITGQHHGMTLISMPGSHSPFLSRPAELAASLDTVASDC